MAELEAKDFSQNTNYSMAPPPAAPTTQPVTEAAEEGEDTTAAPARRRRFAPGLMSLGRREKRALKFRCNQTMVYGIRFYDVYHKQGIKANR